MTVSLRDVKKSYGAIRVLEGISLEIRAGSSLCIFGPSGCGKSTLLKIIALMTRADSGSLMIDDRELSPATMAEIEGVRREKVSYAFQEPLLLPYLTALENIVDIVDISKGEALEMLSSLGLADRIRHKPSKLSVGEKKRVDIARALLRKKEILVADEPFSNLDPDTVAIVMRQFDNHLTKGGILVFSSVDPSETRFAHKSLRMSS
jgi:ABC-type lipoprotein export system ATPase subunit